MANIIFWASLGVLLLALLIGFLVGLSRGLKRSGMHIAFLLVAIVVSFLLTKTITKAILGITLPIDNGKYTISEYILHMVNKSFDISAFDNISGFVTSIPNAIVSPIMFILLSLVLFGLFDIAYLITARLVFGKKKKDFEEHRPYRAFGGVVGLFEGLIVIILIFSPLSALTGTYKTLTQMDAVSNNTKVQSISQFTEKNIPDVVDEIVISFDKSPVGKLPKVFGLNNAMFDGLSSFKVNGKKITFRKEIINYAYAYNNFVKVYNNIYTKNYSNITLEDFRASLNFVLDGNLFDAVVADTVDQLVKDYDNLSSKLPFTTPQLMDDIVAEVKATFKQAGFNASSYLKHDINAVLDTADVIFKNDLITKYKNIPNKKDFVEILKFVGENNKNKEINTIANKALSMNIVGDSFPVLVDRASTKVADMFKGKEHEVALNTNIEDKNETVDNLLNIVDSLLDLDKSLSLSDLFTMQSDKILDVLTKAENISQTLTKVGTVFDDVRNFDLLILPEVVEVGAGGEEVVVKEKTLVFDNILKNYGVDLLGDEVYPALDSGDDEKVVIDSYTKFFNFIAGPVDMADELWLIKLVNNEVVFDDVLDRVLLYLRAENPQLLTRIVMPLYQLQKMNIRSLTFDKVVTNLQTNVSILSLDEVIALDNYHTWVEEFNYIGQTLDLLNTGKKLDGTSEIEGYDNTYIKYLLQANPDLEKVMKALLANERLSGILNNVFSAKVFDGLTGDIFDVLDNNVRDLTGTTGLVFKTDRTNLGATKESTISTIEGILDVLLSNGEVSISTYGKILDLLKVNAANGGTKDGVFNNIFVNVIWYLTGDDLTDSTPGAKDGIFATYTPHENAADIKAFLNTNDYYADALSYEEKLAEAEKAIDLAKKIDQNVSFAISADNTLADIVNGIDVSLQGIQEEEKVKIINDFDRILSNKGETLLDSTFDQKADLKTAIDEKFGSGTGVSEALTKLLKL